MKKLLKIAFLIAIVFIVGTPLLMFAQDTTTVANPGALTNSIGQTLVSWLELKWPVIGTIGSVLFLISEALGNIASVKANSVFQLVSGVLKSLFGKKSA